MSRCSRGSPIQTVGRSARTDKSQLRVVACRPAPPDQVSGSRPSAVNLGACCCRDQTSTSGQESPLTLSGLAHKTLEPSTPEVEVHPRLERREDCQLERPVVLLLV